MSAAPMEVRAVFGDGEHLFSLAKIGQVRELEEKRRVGIGVIYHRLIAGEYAIDDIGEVIRLGLIGGGRSPVEAFDLVARYVYGRPLAESVSLAIAIVLVRLHGQPADEGATDEGKATAAAGMATTTAEPTSPPSTAPAP